MNLVTLSKRFGTNYDTLMSFFGMDFEIGGLKHGGRPLGHYGLTEDLPPSYVAAMTQIWLDAPDNEVLPEPYVDPEIVRDTFQGWPNI